MDRNLGFGTRVVAGWKKPHPSTRPINPPIYQSTTYVYDDLEAFMQGGSEAMLGKGQPSLGRLFHVFVGHQVIFMHAQAVLGHDRHTVLGFRIPSVGQGREQPHCVGEVLGLEGSDATAQIHIRP